MNIEKLEKVFNGKGEVSGYVFKQLKETEHAYLYEVSYNDKKHYEVIRKLKAAKCIDFKKRIYDENNFKEYYPKSNSFGINGWTLKSLQEAYAKLSLINSLD